METLHGARGDENVVERHELQQRFAQRFDFALGQDGNNFFQEVQQME
jgi:hypothetical protein